DRDGATAGQARSAKRRTASPHPDGPPAGRRVGHERARTRLAPRCGRACSSPPRTLFHQLERRLAGRQGDG
ncbi:hypothetical protein ACE14D_23780, partial [Streptomyces sp. Act-28]